MPTDLPDARVTGGTLSVDLELTGAPLLLLPAVSITVTPVRVRLTYGGFDADAFVAVRVEGRDERGFVDYYDFNRRADWPQWLTALIGEHRPAAHAALVRTAALTEAEAAVRELIPALQREYPEEPSNSPWCCGVQDAATAISQLATAPKEQS